VGTQYRQVLQRWLKQVCDLFIVDLPSTSKKERDHNQATKLKLRSIAEWIGFWLQHFCTSVVSRLEMYLKEGAAALEP
jgi:hypothetical protein